MQGGDSIAPLIESARQARAEGDAAKAAELYEQATAMARAASNCEWLAHALRHLSDLYREGGRADEALTVADEAIELYRAQQSQSLALANALRLRALALEVLGNGLEAQSAWREAHGLYAHANVDAGVAECAARLSA